MRNDWKYLPLGDICELLNGFAFRSSVYVNEGIRVIRIANVQKGYIEDSAPAFYPFSYEKELSRYMLQEGDLLMSLTGNVGRVGILYKEMLPAALNQRVACIRLRKKDVLLKYLFHYFNSNFFEAQCIASSHGAAQLNMSTVWLAKHLVPVPPLSEQERIVSLLDEQFAKIDALKANAASQLKAAKDLFQAALKQLLTPQKGWDEKKLGEICEIARGGSPRPIKDYITNAPNSVNWIKIGDTDPAGKYIYETKEKIKPEGIKKSNSMSFGRPYILKTNGCIHDGWLVLRNYNKDLYIDFFYYVLTSPDIQHQFTIKAQGSTVSNLNTDRVASVSISFPFLPEQERIAARLDEISKKVKALQANYDQTINLCNDLKQALLKSIFA